MEIKTEIKSLLQEINEICIEENRDPKEIIVIAASKKQSVLSIKKAFLNGITNSPFKFPWENIFFSLLFIILGTNILVIFVISFISFSIKATSVLFNKKSELKKDFSDKNKSNFNKSITWFLTRTFGFCSLTARLNSFRFK